MRLCLAEDNSVPDLEPLASTRPVSDLLLGAYTLGDRVTRAFRLDGRPLRKGMVIRPHLAALQRERTPETSVNDPKFLAAGPTLVVNGRWVPGPATPAATRGGRWVGVCEGRTACAVVGPGEADGLEPGQVDSWFADVEGRLERREVGGWWVRRPWDLVAKNGEQLAADFVPPRSAAASRRGLELGRAAVIGRADLVSVHPSARVEPFCTFDTTTGPITIAEGAVVQSFTRIEGPCYVGPGTHLYRAHLRGGVTLGRCCRIGGEVEASIVHGFTNKYHEGFLGHSYVGEWVNLGALTSSSDLRNDYGEVSVPMRGDSVKTGQVKVGCFIGDHTRTAMGSLLNTGTVAGVMCNVLPAGPLLPKHIPSFVAVRYGRIAPNVSVERLFETARVVKGRRGQVFTPVEEQLFLDLFEQTRLERARAYQKTNPGRHVWQPVPAVVSSAD